MEFETGPINPEAGKWYITRSGLMVKVVADDLPSESGHSVMAIHYKPDSWSLQTLLPSGRISETEDMPEDLLFEAFTGDTDEAN